MSATLLPANWRAYEPTRANPWDRRKVAHLYRRAGFGASWKELEQGVKLGPGGCLGRVMNGTGPEDLDSIALLAIATGNDRFLQGWWIARMLHTDRPLVERMTLFWHDHFATSQDKVSNLELMHRQNELFRKMALGQFWDRQTGGLLLAVSRDPAMLLWLDSNSNRRSAPNENFARELMELFALGLGNYTEKDIQEAARAFSGWFVKGSEFRFVSSEHDTGSKTVLGRTGDWDGDDVVRIVAEQPAAAEFLVRKLYRYLVNEMDPPDEKLIAPLAAAFRRRQFDMRWLVQTMLSSNTFFSANAYRRKISSPVDFIIGTVRRLEMSRVSPAALADVCSQLGQTLFHPPNVAGWEAGRVWINSSTLLGRNNFAQEIVADRGGRFAGRFDPADLAARYGRSTNQNLLDFFVELLVDGQLPAETRAQLAGSLSRPVRDGRRFGGGNGRDVKIRRLVQLILSLPEYNLC